MKARKPTGYIVTAWIERSGGGAGGTVWNCAKSLREAMKWGQSHMNRGPEAYFTLQPLFGPVA
jgi:hypothetical protein